MRVDFDQTSPQDWHEHFEVSKGDLFLGDRYQRGGSLGSFLRGLLRFVLPVMKTAGTAVAKEAIRTGAAIATDVVEGEDIKEAAIKRAKQGARNLATQVQSGKGLGKRPHNSINTVAPPPQKKRKKQAKVVKKKKDALGFYTD